MGQFKYTDSIREYDIATNEWTELDVKLPNDECSAHDIGRMGMGITSILDGEYIALFGGAAIHNRGSAGGSHKIYVYSVKYQTFTMSNIVCPISLEWQAVSVRNKLEEEKTAFGFVRTQWAELEIDQWFPPRYILSLIDRYYWNEQIHLFDSWEEESGYHYRIDAIKLIGD